MKSLNTAPFRVTFGALSLMLLCTGSAMASTNALGLDPSLNLLVFENFEVISSDVEGRVAVGGNASMSSYSINAHNLAGTALTVGGNLSFSSGTIAGNTSVGGNLVSNYGGTYGGNVAVGGNLDAKDGISGGSSNTVTVWGNTTGYQNWYQPQLLKGSGSFSQGVDFDALRTSLTSLSTRLDGLAAASAVDSWGTWVFDATNNANGINVFDITSAQAAQNMRIDGLGANGTVIINVLGSTVNFGNHGFTNFNNRVLFNLPEATTLQLGWVDASILAPFASVGSGYGLVEGQVVVANWASSVQINDAPFVGHVPLAPIPEPETYAMLLAGLGLMGAVVKRRKAKLA